MKCAECARKFRPARRRGRTAQKFCSRSCQTTYRNRWARRGAIVGPLIAQQRADRPGAAALGNDRTFVTRLFALWRRQDEEAGRAPFLNVREIMEEYAPRVNAQKGAV